MAFENFVEDIFTGDFSDAKRRFDQWYSGLLPEFQAALHYFASAEGQIVQGLAVTAAKDVIAGGLTTASFVAAGKDVIAQAKTQEINVGTQMAFTALNAVVAANAPAVVPAAPAPTPSEPAA